MTGEGYLCGASSGPRRPPPSTPLGSSATGVDSPRALPGVARGPGLSGVSQRPLVRSMHAPTSRREQTSTVYMGNQADGCPVPGGAREQHSAGLDCSHPAGGSRCRRTHTGRACTRGSQMHGVLSGSTSSPW